MCAVSTRFSDLPNTQKGKPNHWWTLAWRPEWHRQKIICDGFRLVTFGAGILQILAFPDAPGYAASNLAGLLAALGFYSILKIAQPFQWQQKRGINVLLLAADIAACMLAVHLTGGIESPFILYTLLPVLTAALLKDFMVTILVSVVTSAYVLAGNIFNPVSRDALTLQAVNDFLVYLIALCLVAILPYAVNLRLGRQLQSGAAVTERKRLSRDLHDGVCQDLVGLRWQMQRLADAIVIDDRSSNEIKKMKELIDATEQDARGLLDILRTIGDNGMFLSNMRQYLEHLKHYGGISYNLEGDSTDMRLAGFVERELSMICIEALSNVKKHAGAKNVTFNVQKVDGRVEIKITDDGGGFDGSGKLARAGHGMAIMRERAESIGGTLRVTSAVGAGTEIVIDVPDGNGD